MLTNYKWREANITYVLGGEGEAMTIFGTHGIRGGRDGNKNILHIFLQAYMYATTFRAYTDIVKCDCIFGYITG